MITASYFQLSFFVGLPRRLIVEGVFTVTVRCRCSWVWNWEEFVTECLHRQKVRQMESKNVIEDRIITGNTHHLVSWTVNRNMNPFVALLFMKPLYMIANRISSLATRQSQQRFVSTNPTTMLGILEEVQSGNLECRHAESLISKLSHSTPGDTLKAFANLDHTRSSRTGFPEAVFAEGKTPEQVAKILDDFARNLNDEIKCGELVHSRRAILATRVSPEQFKAITSMEMHHGKIHYHETARIISMTASGLEEVGVVKNIQQTSMKRVLVATAGTTDLPVAEEAAVTLEAAGCEVDRIADVGVAGLHRIIKALPRLQDPNVGCVIVCAGMDGALPSVVGGLAKVPVIACPTSIGYGVSLSGISAMLTMLNSCSPGVGVVNIDNGFGAAALAYKCVLQTTKLV